MTAQTDQMVDVAKAYCDLIERTARTKPPEGWLAEVAALLPRINAAVASLEPGPQGGYSASPDMDARFDLYARLHDLLGELDAYWLEFDTVGDETCRSGSLADDLTDIYCELKSGLDQVRRASSSHGTRKAMANWRTGYRQHWGRHLMDAQRHLIDLNVLG